MEGLSFTLEPSDVAAGWPNSQATEVSCEVSAPLEEPKAEPDAATEADSAACISRDCVVASVLEPTLRTAAGLQLMREIMTNYQTYTKL